MSGIAGLVHADGRPVSADRLDRIATAAAVRADDGVALWRDGPVGLIRFRHATTPEALGERQPTPSESGAVIVFDGRLDNRAELLALLGARGAALRTRPDEEIAMALFEARGDAFVAALVGDFAFAIWQPRERRLFCARSPVGFRPFRFTADKQRFAFASEPRALVVGLPLERRLNEAAIAETLAHRQVTREVTHWQGIENLPQGSALEYRNGTLRRWHWDDAPHEDLSRVSEREHVERFTALFDQALVACTRSITPVVSQLSGGLDSSSVLSRATVLHRSGRIDRPVAAITARFPGSSVDESDWSGIVERHLGIEARVVSGGAFDLAEAHAWSASTLHPPLRPNTIDTLQNIFRDLQQRDERVLLSGEGGDELLNGNTVHWSDEMARGRIDLVAREAFAAPGATPLRAIRAMLMEGVAPHVSTTRYRRIARREFWAGRPLPDYLDAGWIKRTALADRIAAARPSAQMNTMAAQNRYAVIDLATRDSGFGPVASYAATCGVEYRHPLYDQRLLRFYLGASGAVLYKNGVRRHLLREAMRGTLAEPVRQRTDKAIFNTLVMDGIATCLAARPIERLWPVQLGWLRGDRLSHIWAAYRAWREAGARLPLPDLPFGIIWSAVALDIWLEHGFGL